MSLFPFTDIPFYISLGVFIVTDLLLLYQFTRWRFANYENKNLNVFSKNRKNIKKYEEFDQKTRKKMKSEKSF